jgi:hypothetical protein
LKQCLTFHARLPALAEVECSNRQENVKRPASPVDLRWHAYQFIPDINEENGKGFTRLTMRSLRGRRDGL